MLRLNFFQWFENLKTQAKLLTVFGLVGVIIAMVTLAVFWWTLRTTGDMTLARTVAVTLSVRSAVPPAVPVV